MAGICIIKEVHLCVPFILAAEVKLTIELHVKAEPLPGNGWGGPRAISTEDQPRLRQQFLAIWWGFFGHSLLLLVSAVHRQGRASLLPFAGAVVGTCHMSSLILPADLRKYVLFFPFLQRRKLQLRQFKSFAKAANWPRYFLPQWAAFHF